MDADRDNDKKTIMYLLTRLNEERKHIAEVMNENKILKDLLYHNQEHIEVNKGKQLWLL